MIAERILMGLLLGGVAIGCVLVLYPFFSALLWAAILVYTTWPFAEMLRVRLRLRHSVAAGLMVLLTAVVLVLPIALTAPSGAEDVANLRHAIEGALRQGLPLSPAWVFDLPLVGPAVGTLWNRWAADIGVLLEALRPYFGIVLEGGLGLLLGIANGVLMFLLALFIAFFFWVHGQPIADRLSRLLHRIAGPHADRLITVTGATVRGVVYGILGTAIVQGILTAFGLWLSGVPRPMLLGGVAGLISVLPIGAPVVWIPAAIWLIGSGHIGWGIFLAVYGGVVVSGADSVIRPWFIARGAQLPFMLTVLGVFGGALAFGLLGIFLGPVLLGVGYTLVNEWATADATTPEADAMSPVPGGHPGRNSGSHPGGTLGGDPGGHLGAYPGAHAGPAESVPMDGSAMPPSGAAAGAPGSGRSRVLGNAAEPLVGALGRQATATAEASSEPLATNAAAQSRSAPIG